jgi:hypothetical protein
VVCTEQAQIEEQGLHLDVADAFPEAERGGVYAVGAGLDRGQAIREPEPAVPMAMPVDAHIGIVSADKADEALHAGGGGDANGIGEADAPRARMNGRAVERD